MKSIYPLIRLTSPFKRHFPVKAFYDVLKNNQVYLIFNPPQSHVYVNLGQQFRDKKVIKEELR